MFKLVNMKGDPTRTIMLRKNFVDQFIRRFNSLKRLITKSIVDNNCFGIDKTSVKAFRDPSGDWNKNISPLNKIRNKTNSEKIASFMKWLSDSEEKSLFQLVRFPRVGKGINPLWSNIYIANAYKHGMLWARANIKTRPKLANELNIDIDKISTDYDSVSRSFNQPVNADRVALVYTRSYNDLRGVTATMDAQISEILAEGMALGFNPVKVAKDISERIDKIGKHRATLIARTEMIRSHHLAAIQSYRDYGIEKVKVNAEWLTAGDDRVCPLCAPLNGKIFSLNEVEGKIPVHPQCRCATIPTLEEKKENKNVSK